jgi:c-di-GMP phosphodiesterase
MTAPAESVHVARQPILDGRQQVFGYELLYRAREADTVSTGMQVRASARVIASTLQDIGFDVLTNGHRAFINLSSETLLADAGALFEPDRVVLELLEGVRVTPEVVAMCQSLHERHYALALDDFVPGSGADALLPFVKFVKLDMLALSPARLATAAAQLAGRGLTVVAEKVETVEAFERARTAGCTLFQGYYFCKPIRFSSQTLSTSQISQMRLIAALYKPSISLATIEDLLKRDTALTYRVLRTVNSAAMGLRREVRSVRDALLLLGLDQIRKWTSVWLLAGANRGASEVVTMTVVRGRACELIGKTLGRADGGAEYFLLGLCSLLDTVLGQPMARVVADLPLGDEVRQALLGSPNEARRLLDVVITYEQGRFQDASTLATAMGLDLEVVADAYAEALQWSRGFLGSEAAAA